MAPLLKPDDCCMLLIDPVQRNVLQASVDQEHRHTLVSRHTLLQRAARLLEVPKFFAIYGDRVDDGQWIVPPSERSGTRTYIVDPMSSLWSQQEISVALAEQERTCLVLCGYWLERGVTFAALNALADGFDVFVLMDVSPSYDKHSQEPAVGRLLQAGVVPLTTAQMVGEWAEEETDEARRSLLFDLLRAT